MKTDVSFRCSATVCPDWPASRRSATTSGTKQRSAGISPAMFAAPLRADLSSEMRSLSSLPN